MRGLAESPDDRQDRRLMGMLLLICAGAAIATLPTTLVRAGWVVAFVLPAACYVMLGTGWRRLLMATLLQLACAGLAYSKLGPLRPEAALALSLLPPLTFFTLRRQPHDTGLALFLSFCFLLIGTMLGHGRSDWRLLLFLCAGGMAMQVEASAKAHLVRHAHRSDPAPRWTLTAGRARIMALMLLVGSLLYVGMGALPQAHSEPSALKPPRESVANRGSSTGLSHDFDLTGTIGNPLRIDSDRVLVATSSEQVATDLYLRMTYFDKAGTNKWFTEKPPLRTKTAGPNGLMVAMPVPRMKTRTLVLSLQKAMPGGELFAPPGMFRIRGVRTLEVNEELCFFRALGNNQHYIVEFQQLEGHARSEPLSRTLGHREMLQRLPPALQSTRLKTLTSEFMRHLPRTSSAIDVARALARGLQSRCRYALREPSGEQADPLHRFLFGSREGYCMHFATALAVMLRLKQIPCRIGVGFYGGDPDPSDPLRKRMFGSQHAHAWVEIPLERSGWVVMDATPPADRAGPGWPTAGTTKTADAKTIEPEQGESACMFAAIAPLLDEPLGFLDNPLDYPDTMALLGALLFAGILWSWLVLVRERRGKQLVAPQKKLSGDSYRVRQRLEQILRALDGRGYPRPRNCTLEAFLGHLGNTRVAEPVDLDALGRGFMAYQEVRFGTRGLDQDRVQDLEAALVSARRL